jgi:hypothetical protein
MLFKHFTGETAKARVCDKSPANSSFTASVPCFFWVGGEHFLWCFIEQVLFSVASEPSLLPRIVFRHDTTP